VLADTISQLSQQHFSVCSCDFDYHCCCCCYKRFHPAFASRERGMSDAAARAVMLCSTMAHFLQHCSVATINPLFTGGSCDCCCYYCFERWAFWPFGAAAAAPSVVLLVKCLCCRLHATAPVYLIRLLLRAAAPENQFNHDN